jgi:hypothetical protein
LIESVWFTFSSALSLFGFAAVSVLTMGGDHTATVAHSSPSMPSALLLVTSVVLWVADFLFRRKTSRSATA